ncbi:AbrB/MazE/SpoVT family DNA-binding domain-containing protein [Clostridium botulinum]|uniref:AbrB/MazE/SpoVT family DNA-binding domain-containing protein n=1 Tax=Clostridium botulinum TaxID=1491 RepID=UPI0006A6AD35|nr:AbrB/MazE/SpoVT family DNA-binding domain-containing protein [Clostridium botulinum]KAI3346579.1 AbrB/MazE/SpoVT family DNA-binding domain-containing protein [Clostridium botulinum]KOM86594.1 AbrB family transcriptional regulator [Clostridium botulinum]KOR55757.1 AbrB family transcriptional regulator [Clostridium botulinum]MCS6111349.1 AbrB/MazE/SpoVT family DNA-binding domain-containing protein [Clostridium botulinum]NFL42578.1 AbrB/MazE/SpoVT family DNA-binding domain-containing protein [
MIDEGIIRNLDALGRIVVPKEMRKLLCVKEGDPVRIIKNNDSIIIKKCKNSCVFCEAEDNIFEFQNMCICKDCKDKLMQIK